MGITGLLPFLKGKERGGATRPAHLREFAGQTAVIDVYCWLHKGAFGCAEQLLRGQATDMYVRYVMRWCNLLLDHRIKPILVFDGSNLPSKKVTEDKRRKKRKEARELAVQLMKEGGPSDALHRAMQMSVDITPPMARAVIEAARERNMDCIIAPYEADAQMAYLNMCGLAQLVITEDSDLTMFGCDKILFKLKETGDCVFYNRADLNKVFGNNAANWNFTRFRHMCITAGCDYLPSLPNIGMGKAAKFWGKVTNPDLRVTLRKLPTYLSMPGLVVSQEYIDLFVAADLTFLHQVVFDPVRREEVHLTPVPPELEGADLSYCGAFAPSPSTALQLALGNLDLRTRAVVSTYNPDCPPPPTDKPRYGPRTPHPSMWRAGAGSAPLALLSPSSPLPIAPSPSARPTAARVEKVARVAAPPRQLEKRKVMEEEDIAAMLHQDLPGSPPAKRCRPEVPSGARLARMVGATEAPQQKTVSSYFGSSGGTAAAPGRNGVRPAESGAWLEALERPATAEGKFIYRPQLQEIDNLTASPSPTPRLEGKTDTPRRNPFKKVAMASLEKEKQEVVEVEKTEEKEDGKEDGKEEDSGVFSADISQTSPISISSQATESQCTFSSEASGSLGSASPGEAWGQGRLTTPSQGIRLGLSRLSSASSTKPPSSLTKPPSSLTKPTSSLTKPPSLTKPTSSLTKPTSLGKSSSKPPTALGPARVSGLVRPAKPAMKQGSLVAMFARTVRRAELGPAPSQEAQ